MKQERCSVCGLPAIEKCKECPQCLTAYNQPVCHVRKPCKVVPKGWGKEIWIANNDKYCGKILCMDRGKGFSDHFHINKTETFYVLCGFGTLILREKDGREYTYQLEKGMCIDITPGLMHEIKASCYLELMEVSTHHEDEDSYRVKKGD